MKILLGSLLAIVSLAWGMDVLTTGGSSGGSLPWIIRQEALYLSGLLSIALMSLAMLLSTRPAWLETPLGGMDRVYRTHKWAGILAVSFAIVHWLVEEVVGDILKAMVGREGRIPKEQFTGFLEVMRDLAKDMGEWAFYLVLAMLFITLWKRIPYKPWRVVHQAMPVLYLMLALHAAMLAPVDYWTQPVGMLMGLLGAAGIYGALYSLVGRIGRTHAKPAEP
jgi:predicted ferric reductase